MTKRRVKNLLDNKLKPIDIVMICFVQNQLLVLAADAVESMSFTVQIPENIVMQLYNALYFMATQQRQGKIMCSFD